MRASRATTPVGMEPAASGARLADAGVSVLELLITTALFLVLLTVLSVCLRTSFGSYSSVNAFIATQEAARRALDTMGRELRSASAVAIGGGGTQLDFQMALTYNPVICPPTGICWGAQDPAGIDQPGWQLRYRLNGTTLIRETRDGGGIIRGSRVLANDITQLAFCGVACTGSDDVVAIALQAQQTSQQLPGGVAGTGATPLQARVKLRNF